MNTTLKRNVQAINWNVRENGEFLYITNARSSFHVATERVSDEIFKLIKTNYRTPMSAGCGDGLCTHNIKQTALRMEVSGSKTVTKEQLCP
ncbi:hypothetical protein [Spirosoma agri]|uniref:Uncharacterized protein n=1 Tax=Spirosoma agri TaxID=1987381 RepID=A0A6M0IQV1_9BACT|nr:hypothetical protein [Spirosoma agri]NEU70676.1 hypothetical protein [Spirosoma agri]